LTDFNKLTPEPSIEIFSGFGNAVSVYEDFMAVGIPFSDSLGRGVGLVKLYQLVNNQWINIATLNPKVVYEGMRFGTTLHLSNNYLLIGSQHNKGIVHLFKKQGNNWASSTELTILSNSFATNFGTYHNNNLEISDDENIIAIADVNYSDATMPRDRRGAIFIYQKMNNDEWINQTTPFVLKAFEKDIADFVSSGIIIKGNRLFTGTAFTNAGTI